LNTPPAKVNVDLHTHCRQMTGASVPDSVSVRRILAQVAKQGLDGIAVTEHHDPEYGLRFQQIAQSAFSDKLIVIPGQEVRMGPQHIVELYLRDHATFSFWAHPNFLSPGVDEFIRENLGRLQGIEVRNSCHVLDTERIASLAERYDLVLLSNSDAHTIDTIGYFHSEIDMAELRRRAGRRLNRVC